MERAPGYFGAYGGRYVSETLVPALEELEQACREVVASPEFQRTWRGLLASYVGRPSALTAADRLRAIYDPSGNRINSLYLKREDLNHTGAHKINNALGQALLAKHMGKPRVIAETGAGQHGVATATACAFLGLSCEVFMGELDVARQAPNVARMRLLGAKVTPVTSGSRVLKDAMNEAMRDWVTNVKSTFYCLGTAAGPHPYPTLVRDLQRVIGDEAKEQLASAGVAGGLPDLVVACIGGGSNAIGIFAPFVEDPSVALVGVEAAGHGIDTDKHAATLTKGKVGVLHGFRSMFLSDDDGQIVEAHSISAGLDYPGVGPQHAALRDSGRARYLTATDEEALAAVELVAQREGILIALESAHAFAALPAAIELVWQERKRPLNVLVCLSGRGDKDLGTLIARMDSRGGKS